LAGPPAFESSIQSDVPKLNGKVIFHGEFVDFPNLLGALICWWLRQTTEIIVINHAIAAYLNSLIYFAEQTGFESSMTEECRKSG